MEIHLQIIGILLMLLGVIHVIFPKYFDWKNDLKSLSLINRQMMEVHTFFIALTVFLMGFLCFFSPQDLINTPLGRQICLGFAVFWVIRLFFQGFVYSSKLWRGKTFETSMHLIFTIFWTYLTVVFAFIFAGKIF
jgi:hypothetical protein